MARWKPKTNHSIVCISFSFHRGKFNEAKAWARRGRLTPTIANESLPSLAAHVAANKKWKSWYFSLFILVWANILGQKWKSLSGYVIAALDLLLQGAETRRACCRLKNDYKRSWKRVENASTIRIFHRLRNVTFLFDDCGNEMSLKLLKQFTGSLHTK